MKEDEAFLPYCAIADTLGTNYKKLERDLANPESLADELKEEYKIKAKKLL